MDTFVMLFVGESRLRLCVEGFYSHILHRFLHKLFPHTMAISEQLFMNPSIAVEGKIRIDVIYGI